MLRDLVLRAEKGNASAEEARYVKEAEIDNDVIFGSLSLQGGRLDDIALHEHYDTLAREDNVVVLSPKDTEHLLRRFGLAVFSEEQQRLDRSWSTGI